MHGLINSDSSDLNRSSLLDDETLDQPADIEKVVQDKSESDEHDEPEKELDQPEEPVLVSDSEAKRVTDEIG